MHTYIDWNYPRPRDGLDGMLDKVFGPGTSPAEAWLQGTFVVAAAVLLPTYAFLKGLEWTPVQYLVAITLVSYTVGGIVTNATSSANRWYYYEGQAPRRQAGFVALHVVCIFLAAWLFRSMDWVFFGAVSLYVLGSASTVLKSPRYLQRPLAFGLLSLSFLLSTYVFSPTAGLEWLVPLLCLKLVTCHF